MICVYPADCTDFSTNGNGTLGKAKAVGRHAIDAGKGARKMLTAVEARFRRNIHHRKA